MAPHRVTIPVNEETAVTHDILHDFPIAAPIERVFHAISTPAECDRWWTLRCEGTPRLGAEYRLDFGESFDWRAVVSELTPPRRFEWTITAADSDWTDTRVGFELSESDGSTLVRFHHRGWREGNAHYRQSSFCWAMYLRLLRRYVEHGEVVPYPERL